MTRETKRTFPESGWRHGSYHGSSAVAAFALLLLAGCSGGGVLSSWVIGHTDRFAAAAVRCPVIDWISMAGHTDIPVFTYSFFKKPFWEDPSDWLAHSSLMTNRGAE